MVRRIVFSVALLLILVFVVYHTNDYQFLKKRFSSNLNYVLKEQDKELINEVLDIISSSKRFYILDKIQEEWEEKILKKAGDVAYRPSVPYSYYKAQEEPVMPADYLFFSAASGHLYISDDFSAYVIWEINFPQPLKRGFLFCVVQTSTPDIEIVAISRDLEEWIPLSVSPSSRNVDIIKDLSRFKGTQKIYIKFYKSQPSQARFYGYMVLAEMY